MLSYNELKVGTFIVQNGDPYQVVEYEFLRMQQRKPVVKTKLRNLITGAVQEKSFQHSDEIEEAEIERMESRFIFENRGVYWFDEANNPKNRFSFTKEAMGDKAQYLKSNMPVITLTFNGKNIGIELPIKFDYEVIEAPPAIKGDTAQGGSKNVIIESGAKISAPLFVNEGDIIRVNTQTGGYIERVEKKS